jgi:hypothetical protein
MVSASGARHTGKDNPQNGEGRNHSSFFVCPASFLNPSKYALGDQPTLKLSMINGSIRPSPKSLAFPITSAAPDATIPVAVESIASAPSAVAPAVAPHPTASIVTSFKNLRGAVSKSPVRLVHASTYSRMSSISESALSVEIQLLKFFAIVA